jgi:hypothetical protein
MQNNIKDITGQKFGLLTALRYIETKNTHAYWECECECGNRIIADGSNLRRGHSTSCGCLLSENLKNKRFGRLLVLEKTDIKQADNGYYWKCICDCGKEVLVPSHSLKSGNTQSCGCLRKDNTIKAAGNRLKDITGQRFGKLVVIDKAARPEKGATNAQYWLCQCDCGNQKIISGKGLRKKDGTKSCGCLVKETRNKHTDLTGKKFGRLLVIKQNAKIGNHNMKYWDCLCDCGNTKIISGGSLRSGSTQSCGCLRSESAHLTNNIGDTKASFNYLYSSYKNSARIRNLDFQLDKETFKYYTKQECYYCGCEPEHEQKNKSKTGNYIYNGIDRIDNTKGYIEGNIVSCCSICNYAKHVVPQQEFFEWVQKVNNNLIAKGLITI